MQSIVQLGYVVRPAQRADAEAAVELFNVCSRHLIGRGQLTVNDIHTEWGTPGFDLEADTRLVLHRDQPVGYVEHWNLNPPYVRPAFWGRVHPEHTGRGIGTGLVAWGEARARAMLPAAPEEAQVVLGQGVWEQDRRTRALLGTHGYTVARRFLRMRADFNGALPAPAWPEGIALRPFELDRDLDPLIRAVDDAFSDHWGHVPGPLDQRIPMWRQWIEGDVEFDPGLWFVAVEGDEIAGFSLCRRTDTEDASIGWVSILGVRRPWRRLGLALALLHHSFRELRRRGQVGVGLGVDATSLTGADRLYLRAGMRPERSSLTMEKVLRRGVDLRKTVL